MVQPTVDLALNLGIFVWIGATMPWQDFVSTFALWKFIVMGIALLLFRRLPAVLLFYRIIPDIADLKEAVFTGFFGPIGVGALFYLEVALQEFQGMGLSNSNVMVRTIKPVVYFSILSSVLVHGISIPILQVFLKSTKKLRNKRRQRLTAASTLDTEDTVI
ncbi:Nha1p [Sugiyamaella lignohabitans]|uniref:Nha1p n=1 Tax=Sugiyamaella lignohabitans TaxID=796027 RepID=A0A167DQ17_9ASCO|nr:Nha1p [Sugiyamaella lignohabitans]ANB13155.1 Nha1p [Sugiyamaella lignohabitans]